MKQYGIPKPEFPFKVHQHQQNQSLYGHQTAQKRSNLPPQHGYQKPHEPIMPTHNLQQKNQFFPTSQPIINQQQQAPQTYFNPLNQTQPSMGLNQQPSNLNPNPNRYINQPGIVNQPHVYQPTAISNPLQPQVPQIPTVQPASIYQPTEANYQPPTQSKVQSYIDTKPEVGWNDPPMLTKVKVRLYFRNIFKKLIII